MGNLICKIFGHRTDDDRQWGHYGRLGRWQPVDGTGTQHALIVADCSRCGETYDVCKIHLPVRLPGSHKGPQ
jgi:hypothetical protein